MLEGIKPLLQYLNEDEIEQIHQTSLHLLGKIGVKVDDPEVRDDLYHYGCSVEGDRVKFSPDLIQKVLVHVRKEISFSRPNSQTVEVKPGKVISHSSGGIPSIIDFETGKKRYATLLDFRQAARLMDNLDQLDMPCALFYPEDVPYQMSQVIQTEQLLRYTKKPIYGPGVSSPGEAKYIVELFKAYAGTEISLTEEPIGLVGISPESPLYFPKQITDTMKIIILAGVPTVILSAPVTGLSAPITIAGAIAQMNAEILAFAAIACSINPKTPLIYGSRLNYPNMRNGNSIWGLPEIGIGSAIAVQLARSYGFLSDVYGLASTSCTFDNQIGYEKATNGILPVLAGANLISGFGSMASLMVASLEQLVIDNETFAIQRKVNRGVQVNEDTLALDVTTNVLLDGGNFLEQAHTIRHLRAGEIFIPKLGFDNAWAEWERSGEKDIRVAAKERVSKILANDSYEPISPELDKEVGQIIKFANQELVKN